MGQTERTAPVDTKKRQLQVHDQAETWRVHHGLRWTAGPDLPPTTERHGANWSVRGERGLLMSPLLRWCRALAAMSLVVLLSGLIFWAYLEGWVYLDGPEAEKTAGRLQLSLWTVLPGLVLAVIVWGLTLLGLARCGGGEGSRWCCCRWSPLSRTSSQARSSTLILPPQTLLLTARWT